MNVDRVLLITNQYLLCFGYQIHRYSRIFGTYRISYKGLLSLILINALYMVCLWEHYAKQNQMHLIRYFSELLHDSIYCHLYFGIASYILVAFEFKSLLAVTKGITTAIHDLPTKHGNKSNNRSEAFVYYKMFANSCILISVSIYDLHIIDWHNITLTKVLLIIGLAYPHLLIANVLRFYTINAMQINEIWMHANRKLIDIQLAVEFYSLTVKQCSDRKTIFQNWWKFLEKKKTTESSCKENVIILLESIDSDGVNEKLSRIFKIYEQCQEYYGKLNGSVQRQVLMLIVQHSIIVFITVHVYVKVHLEWYVVMTDVDMNLIRTSFIAYIIMIVNDFVCLFGTGVLCKQEVGYILDKSHVENISILKKIKLRIKK